MEGVGEEVLGMRCWGKGVGGVLKWIVGEEEEEMFEEEALEGGTYSTFLGSKRLPSQRQIKKNVKETNTDNRKKEKVKVVKNKTVIRETNTGKININKLLKGKQT